MEEESIVEVKSRYNAPEYSEQIIQRALYSHFKKMKYRMSNIYMFGGKTAKWESDFFFMASNRTLWEIEVKKNRQDYNRDYELKPKKHDIFNKVYNGELEGGPHVPNFFYFCAPEGIIPHDTIPDYAGLIEIYGEDKDKLRYVKNSKIHDNVSDNTNMLLKKFYSKTLSMEQMIGKFRLDLFNNPSEESEIVKKFLKTLRI